jgi:Enterochelin esterase and related enzymes
MPGSGKRRSRHLAGKLLLCPSEREDDFPAAIFSQSVPDRALLREGWRKLLPRAVADPLNPQSWKGGRGHAVSALEMPEAPEQPGWATPAAHWDAPQCIEWHKHETE